MNRPAWWRLVPPYGPRIAMLLVWLALGAFGLYKLCQIVSGQATFWTWALMVFDAWLIWQAVTGVPQALSCVPVTRAFLNAVNTLAAGQLYIHHDSGHAFFRGQDLRLFGVMPVRTVLVIDSVSADEAITQASLEATLDGSGALAVTWQRYWASPLAAYVMTAADGASATLGPTGDEPQLHDVEPSPLSRRLRRTLPMISHLIASPADVDVLVQQLLAAQLASSGDANDPR